jgi:hypothetical protein
VVTLHVCCNILRSTIFIVDAPRGDDLEYIVHSHDPLTALIEPRRQSDCWLHGTTKMRVELQTKLAADNVALPEQVETLLRAAESAQLQDCMSHSGNNSD